MPKSGDSLLRELTKVPRNPSWSSLSDMQHLLEDLEPATASAALNALRKAFPHIPLCERVSACEAYAKNFRD